MKILLIALLGCIASLFFLKTQSFADSFCGGSNNIWETENLCTDASGNTCTAGFPGCVCKPSCIVSTAREICSEYSYCSLKASGTNCSAAIVDCHGTTCTDPVSPVCDVPCASPNQCVASNLCNAGNGGTPASGTCSSGICCNFSGGAPTSTPIPTNTPVPGAPTSTPTNTPVPGAPTSTPTTGPTPPGGGGPCPATCPAGQTCPSAGCVSGLCVQSQVNVCGDNTQCIPTCSSGGPTATPIPSCPIGQTNPHSQCSGGACTSVSGCGPNRCTSNTYSTCDFGAQQCVVKSSGICGTTPSTCASNSQCYVPDVKCNPLIPPSTLSWTLGTYSGPYSYTITNVTTGAIIARSSSPPASVKTVNYNCTTGTCIYKLDATLNGHPGSATCHYYGPWFSGAGGDMRIDTQFTDELPTNTVHAFLNGSGGTNGIAFSGTNTPDFGENPTNFAQTKNWQVGSGINPQTFHPLSGFLANSYSGLQDILLKNGITPNTPTGNCVNLNCLKSAGQYVHGVYQYNNDIDINSSLQFDTSSVTPKSDGSRNIVLMIKGNLNINNNSTILVGPGVTLTIAVGEVSPGVGGNIIVADTVGETSPFINQETPSTLCDPTVANHGSCDLEGFYIADNQFIVQGKNACPSPDKQLHIAGLVAVNGKFGNASNQFINKRSLCNTPAGSNDNHDYPTITFTERPDMIVNAPDFFKKQTYIWQEVNP